MNTVDLLRNQRIYRGKENFHHPWKMLSAIFITYGAGGGDVKEGRLGDFKRAKERGRA